MRKEKKPSGKTYFKLLKKERNDRKRAKKEERKAAD